MHRRRVAVLISGRGSNMQALAAAAAAPDYPAKVALVVSNVPDAPGLDTAAAAGLPTLTLDHRRYGHDRQAHEAAIVAAMDAAGIELVCLAGWMRLLTPLFVGRYAGRLLNVHPSLLPAFPGLDTHARALAAGVKLHGCTVHLVSEAMDEGPILAQAAVPVLPGDSAEALAARVLAQEHLLYPGVLAAVARGTAMADCAAEATLCNPLPTATAPA